MSKQRKRPGNCPRGANHQGFSPIYKLSSPQVDLARQATELRRIAAKQLVQNRPPIRAMMESLADAVLFDDYSTNYDALRLTHSWIGDSVGITSKDTAVWLEALRDGDGSTRGWVAWAMTIAAAEIRAERNQVWGTPEQ